MTPSDPSEDQSGCRLRTDVRRKGGGACTSWGAAAGVQERKMAAQSQALMEVRSRQDLLTWGAEGSARWGGAPGMAPRCLGWFPEWWAATE